MNLNPFRWFQREERVQTNSGDFPHWLARLFGDWFQSSSGITVTPETALHFTAFYAAVDHISRALIRMPCLFYKYDADGGRTREDKHPLAHILHRAPNSEQTPAAFKQYMMQSILMRGNAYAEIQRDGSGRPIALWPLPAENIEIKRDGAGMLVYWFRKDAQSRPVPMFPLDVLHIHGLGDGMVGFSPVQLFKEAIGLGLSAERAGAKLYANGIRPTGVLETDARFKNKEDQDRLRAQFAENYGGSANTGKPLILASGVKWTPITMSLSDAQFIETRVRQLREIALIFHLPAHKLGDLERATFSNIEEQNLEVVGDCYEPWVILWEEEINSKLLMPSEQGKFFAEFQMDALLRANTESRARAMQTQIYAGYLTRNEARRMENRAMLPGLDAPIMPVNYVMIGDDGEPKPVSAPKEPTPPPKALPEPDAGEERSIGEAHRGLLLDVCGRIVRMQAGALLKARKHADTVQEALDAVFDLDHAGRVVSMLDAPLRAAGSVLNAEVSALLPEFARDYTENCRSASVSDRCEPPIGAERLTEMLIEKLTEHAAKTANGGNGNG